jgi:hypothetical protein
MPKPLKLLGWLALGIVGSLIAYYLAESALLAPLKQHNPVDITMQWLAKTVAIPQIVWWLVLVWSLISFSVVMWMLLDAWKLKRQIADGTVIEAIGPSVHWDWKRGKPYDPKDDHKKDT